MGFKVLEGDMGQGLEYFVKLVVVAVVIIVVGLSLICRVRMETPDYPGPMVLEVYQ